MVKLAATDTMVLDVWRTVADEMKLLPLNMRKLIGSSHPSLDQVAKYYTQAQGKHLRPLIVFLTACAKSEKGSTAHGRAAADTSAKGHGTTESNLDTLVAEVSELMNETRLSHDDFDGQSLPQRQDSSDTLPGKEHDTAECQVPTPEILSGQRRLAEIVELIHTASLLHDDVIDHASSRRGLPSANLAFGNKMATLAGDFLLGRACMAVARLRHAEVMELISEAIANLVEGEFMQLKNTKDDEPNPEWSVDALRYYLQKSYLKTASLIAASSRAAALLGNADSQTVHAATAYGRNLGMAFQVVDDILDYTRSGRELGKPSGADLELGLATAPLLFAWKQMPELGALIGRKFKQKGDVEKARELVLRSDGIAMAYALAIDYSRKAVAAIQDFPESEAKEVLVQIAQWTVRQ
ncbi:hexaprenyl pyrophosphate synthase [Purpureocillium lavendulum]|uniref:Hexaprenyl pyrophosphate synthase n=1 Tax=Purpureocillium lavendulum TaxID=1247861 RepID=A0AB34FGN4_9HYPO|nr:hexaprenyl pyrophosphate synthase [Purpureocillium lavendulum]